MIENESREPFIKICSSLDEAVKSSYNSAKSGDIVIMSPGFESFDMFDDYKQRGEHFKSLI